MKPSFRKIVFSLFTIVLVVMGVGCSKPDAPKKGFGIGEAPTGGFENPESEKRLQIPLEDTTGLREEFKKEFSKIEGFDLREVYEAWIDRIGANGIVTAVQEVYPSCHDEGHDFGKTIYARVQDIPQALNTCEDACYSGCMHGVFMEAFAPNAEKENPELGAYAGSQHVELEDIVEQVDTFCGDELGYRVGDCIHGIGHAFMFLNDYDVKKGVEPCDRFADPGKAFYCATGAYMELTEHAPDLPLGETFLEFCVGMPYPSACFRNRFSRGIKEYYDRKSTFAGLAKACLAMNRNDRLGCFYGIGVAHLEPLMGGQLTLDQLCGAGDADDQYVCVEGAIERIARYYPEKTRGLCLQVTGARREACLVAAENGLYALDKPFEKYYPR